MEELDCFEAYTCHKPLPHTGAQTRVLLDTVVVDEKGGQKMVHRDKDSHVPCRGVSLIAQVHFYIYSSVCTECA